MSLLTQSIRLYDTDGWSDNQSRSEDSLLAYSWLHFIEDQANNTEYILFLPMVKAGVRAMDAVTEFLTSDTAPQEIQDLNMNPTKWGVSGGSKVTKYKTSYLDNNANLIFK